MADPMPADDLSPERFGLTLAFTRDGTPTPRPRAASGVSSGDTIRSLWRAMDDEESEVPTEPRPMVTQDARPVSSLEEDAWEGVAIRIEDRQDVGVVVRDGGRGRFELVALAAAGQMPVGRVAHAHDLAIERLERLARLREGRPAQADDGALADALAGTVALGAFVATVDEALRRLEATVVRAASPELPPVAEGFVPALSALRELNRAMRSIEEDIDQMDAIDLPSLTVAALVRLAGAGVGSEALVGLARTRGIPVAYAARIAAGEPASLVVDADGVASVVGAASSPRPGAGNAPIAQRRTLRASSPWPRWSDLATLLDDVAASGGPRELCVDVLADGPTFGACSIHPVDGVVRFDIVQDGIRVRLVVADIGDLDARMAAVGREPMSDALRDRFAALFARGRAWALAQTSPRAATVGDASDDHGISEDRLFTLSVPPEAIDALLARRRLDAGAGGGLVRARRGRLGTSRPPAVPMVEFTCDVAPSIEADGDGDWIYWLIRPGGTLRIALLRAVYPDGRVALFFPG